MDPFESTIEDPLYFFKSFLNYDAYSHLRKNFESKDPGNDHIYNQEKDTAINFSYSDLEEVVGYFEDGYAIPNEIEWTFDEYIHEEFLNQIRLSDSHILGKSKSNGYDQDLKLYDLLLRDLTDLQKGIDQNLELQFKDELTNGIRQILNHTLRKFNRIYPDIPAYKLAKKYFTGNRNSNFTGFKLKRQARNASIEYFIESLFQHSFVAKIPTKYIKQFLEGQIPEKKINWIKDPHELKYFIEKLNKADILESRPGQPWKYLTEVFTCQGENLSKDWQRNHNLKDSVKKQAIDDRCSMLLPQK